MRWIKTGENEIVNIAVVMFRTDPFDDSAPEFGQITASRQRRAVGVEDGRIDPVNRIAVAQVKPSVRASDRRD